MFKSIALKMIQPKLRKYYKRKLRATRAVTIYAGIGEYVFFPLLRSTKFNFLGLISTATTNLFLGLPSDLFDKMIN
jgi:hypothetical protein